MSNFGVFFRFVFIWDITNDRIKFYYSRRINVIKLETIKIVDLIPTDKLTSDKFTIKMK